MCGGGGFDLNPYASLLLSSTFWSFKKKKAIQRMRWIRDSVLFISCCRNVFLLPSGMFLVEYSKSFTWKFIVKSPQLYSGNNISSSSVEWISKERSTLIP